MDRPDQLSLLGVFPKIPAALCDDAPKASVEQAKPQSKKPLKKQKTPPPVFTPNEPLTVSELTALLKQTVLQHPVLGQSITVQAELSNVSPSSRGHVYFQLKDEQASIKGVLWASVASQLPFNLESGMAVYATGTLDIYAPSGTYSLVVKKIEPVGIGALQLAYQQLKERLDAEGCFDEDLKQPLPSFPWRVGIITAQTGAVIHDMLRVIRRKNPVVSVLLHPVPVQGMGAATAIANAIDELNAVEYGLDVLIIARGGGSFEDLFCFSEESVVRAVVASRLPIVAGIGHEPDFSLSDAAADVSCSTPTAAAECAVPDVYELLAYWESVGQTLARDMQQRLNTAEQKLDVQSDRMCHAMQSILQRVTYELEQAKKDLQADGERVLRTHENRLAQYAAQLDGISPLKVMARGFAAVSTPKGPVTSIHSLAPGQSVTLRLADGTAEGVIQLVTPYS
ncbi:MAG: exodeoxyribonuclease VII large subunit [Vampirovibrionales bacterium]